jgi:hypothetical protein
VQQRPDDKRRRLHAHQRRDPSTDGLVQRLLCVRRHMVIVSSSPRPVVSPGAAFHLLRAR